MEIIQQHWNGLLPAGFNTSEFCPINFITLSTDQLFERSQSQLKSKLKGLRESAKRFFWCRNSLKRLQASPVNDVNDVNDVNADRRWYRLRLRSVGAKFVGSNPAGCLAYAHSSSVVTLNCTGCFTRPRKGLTRLAQSLN